MLVKIFIVFFLGIISTFFVGYYNGCFQNERKLSIYLNTENKSTAKSITNKSFLEISVQKLKADHGKIHKVFNQSIISIESPPEQWAYAAYFDIPKNQLWNGPYAINLLVDLQAGEMDYGVLDKNETQFIAEKSIKENERERLVSLHVPSIEDTSKLVFRNWGKNGVVSRLRVKRIFIYENIEYDLNKTAVIFWVKEYIKRQIPKFESINDWEKISALREWGYANIDMSNEFLDEYSTPLPFLLKELFENRGGFRCGGTAEVMKKIYGLFGYEAFSYNMGEPLESERTSHVINLVRFYHNGKAITSIQDAYFNYTLLDKAGHALDFSKLLDLIKKKKTNEIKMQKPDRKIYKQWTISNSDGKSNFIQKTSSWLKFERYNVKFIRDNHQTSTFIIKDYSMDSYDRLPNYKKWIKERTGSENYFYFYLYPISTSGEDHVEMLAEKARELRKSLFPKGAEKI